MDDTARVTLFLLRLVALITVVCGIIVAMARANLHHDSGAMLGGYEVFTLFVLPVLSGAIGGVVLWALADLVALTALSAQRLARISADQVGSTVPVRGTDEPGGPRAGSWRDIEGRRRHRDLAP